MNLEEGILFSVEREIGRKVAECPQEKYHCRPDRCGLRAVRQVFDYHLDHIVRRKRAYYLHWRASLGPHLRGAY